MANRIGEGRTHYVPSANLAVLHGAPVTKDGFTGTAVKKIAAPAGTGLASSLITTIQVGEAFHIELKGDRYLTNANAAGGTFAVGAAVYIDPDDNTITSAHAGNELKFGRVSEIDDGNGHAIKAGSGEMLVNLDAKDGFV